MTNILIVGRGGREHALAWSLARSQRVRKVFVAPGNAGTATPDAGIENVAIEETDFDQLIAFSIANDVSLAVIGPEAPLAAGIVDCLEEAGVRCFGPVTAAAKLEGSKRFAKELMQRIGIPTADYRVFTNHEEAVAFVRGTANPPVVKASGLAAGRGVFVPNSVAEAEDSLHRLMVTKEFGDAGTEVVIEERLVGREASILAFCDGATVVPMPPAQDHKPLLDGDEGPNTGGMGAYAPTPLVDDALLDTVVKDVMQPVVRALALDGAPYVGVLYAGLMVTSDGPKVLDFNCRFGDPEAQVILPLLDSDLLDILDACVDGTLHETAVAWRDEVAATVVTAAEGYPGDYVTGLPISGLTEAASVPGVTVFHSGTQVGGEILTAGGRVLAVTGVQQNLPMALACAYHGVEHISFEGMHYRTDIGGRSKDGPASHHANGVRQTTYADAGVDLEAGMLAVDMMKKEVRSTYGPEVLAGIGAFGGMYDASGFGDDAILVASTDGVGTKTKVATALHRYDTVGIDIVNHCINDVLVQGARPLFFLDYVATGELDPTVIAAVVGGMARACRDAGCALLGGETAEMPGVYMPDELDVVGTVVGIVSRQEVIDGSRIGTGDAVLGIDSAGLHTNGFSLARKVFEHWDLNDRVAALGTTLGNALLAPHRSYLPEVTLLRERGIDIHSLVHITNGGLVDNPERVLPQDMAMRLELSSWQVPPLFSLIRQQGNIAEHEMYRAFNMGIGMLVVVPQESTAPALSLLGEDARQIGSIVPRNQTAVELI